MSKYERISCHHFIEKNGYAYFSNWFYNGLFKVELESGKTTFLGTFANEQKDEYNIHWELLLQGDLIYFFPRRGGYIHIYSLADRVFYSVEIRTDSEVFFKIGEVVIDGINVFLLPKEEKAPIKCFNLNTWDVTTVTVDTYNSDAGVSLSKSHTVFPNILLLERYHIEKPDIFSWIQMPDGRLCAFFPMGRQILWYKPSTQKIETVPLTVINEEELEEYLLPLRCACLHQGCLLENDKLTFKEYLNTLILQGDSESTQSENHPDFMMGNNIWKYVKN